MSKRSVEAVGVYLKGPGELKGRWKKVKARFIKTKVPNPKYPSKKKAGNRKKDKLKKEKT